jgi:hypothetical protein
MITWLWRVLRAYSERADDCELPYDPFLPE